MARLNQEKILTVAETIIYEKGMEQTTLYDIAEQLNVTHAALYKHFKNKEDLLQQLALRWLRLTSAEIFTWEPQPEQSTAESIHEWLWLLARTKKNLFENDQRMFSLYTTYIEDNLSLIQEHLSHLAEKVESLTTQGVNGQAIITAFVYFHNPYFAPRWHTSDYATQFEAVWQLVAPTFNQV